MDGTFLPPTGDDFRLGTDTDGEFLACCEEDNEEAWPVLLPVEVGVVLGLPPVLLDNEVGEPTIIGGDGDWLLLLLGGG